MKQRAMAIAIVLAFSLTTALPVAAVDASCTKDFDIADSQTLASSRNLDPGVNETGLEDVLAGAADEDVTVHLTSDNSDLEFGIFQESSSCTRSSNVTPTECGSDITLQTGNNDEAKKTCTIEASDSEKREFFFVMENVGDNPLDYEIYVSS